MSIRISHLVGAFVLSISTFGSVANAEAQGTNGEPLKFKSKHYRACDGHWEPTNKDDELDWYYSASDGTLMSKSAQMYGLEGRKACDHVLKDPRVQNTHPIRRANILTAKALHLIKHYEYAKALQVLDEVNAVGETYPSEFFTTGVGLRSKFIRAHALANLNRPDEALPLFEEVAATRTYSPSVSLLAIRQARAIDKDWSRYQRQLDAWASQWPEVNRELFLLHFSAGEFELAVAYAEKITFTLPQNRGPWRIVDSERQQLEDLIRRANLRGAHAYASAAIGRKAEAAAIIERAKAELEAAKPIAPKNMKSKSKVAKFNLARTFHNRAKTELGLWLEALNALKILAEDQTVIGVPAAVLVAPLARSDLARRIAQLNEATDVPAPGFLRDAILKSTLSSLTFEGLIESAPMPESVETIPKIRRAGGGIIRVDNGYSSSPISNSDLYTVRFHSNKAGRERVEELGLMSAAMYARLYEKDSFLIVSRRTLNRTMNTTFNYGTARSDHDGYESQMAVLFVDSDNLPEQYSQQASQLLSTREVLAALEPKYEIRQLPKLPRKR